VVEKKKNSVTSPGGGEKKSKDQPRGVETRKGKRKKPRGLQFRSWGQEKDCASGFVQKPGAASPIFAEMRGEVPKKRKPTSVKVF